MSRTLMATENRSAPNFPTTGVRHSTSPSPRSRRPAARAPSCAWGRQPSVRLEAIRTGAINLDAAIGIGGIPRGRVTEIFGPESSGKTTLALHVVASAQRVGGAAAYIDAEHALDVEYARSSAWTSTTSSCPSRTRASRRSRSPRSWFVLGQSTSS